MNIRRHLVVLGLIYFCVLSAYVESKNTTFIMKELVDDASLKEAMSEIGGRIVSGRTAAANQFPYQAYIMIRFTNNGVDSCGGSLIHERFVLSAAHCFDK